MAAKRQPPAVPTVAPKRKSVKRKSKRTAVKPRPVDVQYERSIGESALIYVNGAPIRGVQNCRIRQTAGDHDELALLEIIVKAIRSDL